MEYLPISEASKIYKTSKTALTRLANKNINSKHIKKENKMFLISVELLESKYEKRVSSSEKENRTRVNTKPNTHEPQKESIGIQTSNQSEPLPKNDTELVTILKTQNEFLQSQIIEKDKQLHDKSSQIDKLLQRQYEQNSIIQTMQNRFESIGQQIDTSTLLLSEKLKENKSLPGSAKENDNGFTVAAAVMILLLVVMIIVYLTVK
ncbi:hypothetical protein [Yeosuana sp.]|uniref:hypothetical protein n=1 Tax=Yeosuana sp. TaxID=2529388 RepID=UPI004054DF17